MDSFLKGCGGTLLTSACKTQKNAEEKDIETAQSLTHYWRSCTPYSSVFGSAVPRCR